MSKTLVYTAAVAFLYCFMFPRLLQQVELRGPDIVDGCSPPRLNLNLVRKPPPGSHLFDITHLRGIVPYYLGAPM